MTVGVTSFKVAFPEFAPYDDEQIAFWLNQGVTSINPRLFGTQYDLALMLFIAHYLSVSLVNQRAVASGGIPGQSIGPVVSKSVGPVSKSMGTFSVDARGGELNNSTYGQRLWALMKASTAGGYYNPGYGTQVPARPANGYIGYAGAPGGRRW